MSNDRIANMRKEIKNKFESKLKEIRTNKSLSNVTNPRPDTKEVQSTQP